MVRRMIPAVLAALLLTGPAIAGQLYTDDPDNPAHVGAWRVSCDHDGNLHGRDFEACSAWVDFNGGRLWFYRNPRDTGVVMELKNCQPDREGSVALDIKRIAPGVVHREGLLLQAIRQSAAIAAKACHRAVPDLKRALVRADVAKVLELTDGLDDFGDDR